LGREAAALKKDGTLLVTGASGFLGAWVVLEARARGLSVLGSSRTPLEGFPWRRADLSRPGEAERLLEEVRPAAVIHAAASSRIPDCRKDPDLARRINVEATAALAAGAARLGAAFLFVSTDHVFDGKSAPYAPGDPPSPLSVYGRTKVQGEEAVRAAGGDWRVVRVSLLFGRSEGRGNLGASEGLLALLDRGERPLLFTDEFRTPLAVDEAARGLLDLLQAPPGRILHLAGPERLSRYDFGVLAVRAAGRDPALLERGLRTDRAEHASRPADLSLDCRETLPYLERPPSPPGVALARIYR